MSWLEKLQEREFLLAVVKVVMTFALIFGFTVVESDVVKIVDGVATAIILSAYILSRGKYKTETYKADAIVIASENAVDAALAGGASNNQ